MERLIIDDFFTISCETASFQAGGESASYGLLKRAKAAYAAESLIGSDEKDIVSQRCFKVAGAEIDTSAPTTADGLALVGYPVEKRLALAAASLRAAQCSHLTPELGDMLCGSWVACLMYRRCLMSVLDKLFSIGRAEMGTPVPRGALRPFTRRAAGELQLLAVLAPVICSNMSAEVCDWIFATDASTTHGAVCSLPVEPSLSLDFWLASDFKGAVHLSPVASLGAAGGDDEASVRECSSTLPAPEKPFAFDFDFIEVGPSGGAVAHQLARGRFRVGPLVDHRRSRQYDLALPSLRDWLLFLISEPVMISPPASSFHPAVKPRLRSVACLAGLFRDEPATLAGNCAVASALLAFSAAVRWGVPALLCVPQVSFICKLPGWIYASQLPGVSASSFCPRAGLGSGPGDIVFLTFKLRLPRLKEGTRSGSSPAGGLLFGLAV